MAILAASSPMPVKAFNFRPSLFESGSSKLKDRRLSQDRRISSQFYLHPVNNTHFRLLNSSASNSTLHRQRLTLDSAHPISFSSSAFLNFCPLNLVAKMRRRAEKGRAEGESGVCRSSLLTREEEVVTDDTVAEEDIRTDDSGGNGGNNGGGNGGGGGGGGGSDAVGWISSALIFAFWAGLILYAFTIAPNQTQFSDTYFIEKLVGLHSDDNFILNKVLVAEWYFMGLWPIIYASLLIPNGRSRKNGVKVWPFSVVSFFLGAFALLPYFGLWRPPRPKVSREELGRYPLNVLESKITAAAIFIGGIVLAVYAGSAGGDQWGEFVQYVQGSRFINVMSVDFLTLSALAPFWVYNDLSAREKSNTSSWLPSIAVVPFFGPSLYLLLRPALASSSIIDGPKERSDSSDSA